MNKTDFCQKRMETKLKSQKFAKQMLVIEDAIRGRYLEMYEVVRQFNGNDYNHEDKEEFIAACQLMLEIVDKQMDVIEELLICSGRYLAEERNEHHN